MRNHTPYSFAADVIRTLALFGVLIIHIGSSIHARADFLGGTSWWIINLLNSASRIAIPLFILLSGYLLLGKQEPLTQIVQRLSRRIIIPLIVWFVIYTWWSAGNPSMTNITGKMFLYFLSANVFHLYFLLIMFGLYTVKPLLHTFLHSLSPKGQQLAGAGSVLIGMISIATQYLAGTCATTAFTVWIPFTGFFITGYVLKQVPLTSKQITLLRVGFLLLVFITSGLNYLNLSLIKAGNFLLHPAGCLSGYFDHYLSPNVVSMSVLAFLLLLAFDYRPILRNRVLTNSIQTIAQRAFGIYLVHILVINFIDVQLHLALDFTNIPLLFYFLVKFIAVFGISFGIVTLGRKIPGIKQLFGEQ